MTELYNNSHSKYTYKLNELDNQVFVFELILKKFNNKNKIIRKIKRNKKGNIICLADNIMYENIDKITLTAIDINNPTQEFIGEIYLDHTKKYSTFINNNIYVEIYANGEYLECNYDFLN
jgi:hypothetical protein